MDNTSASSSPHCFVITGGPGAGKTTLVEALRARGHAGVGESARATILDQKRIGGSGLEWIDPALYAELMLARDLDNFRAFSEHKGQVFFDRGIPELTGYLRIVGLPVPGHFKSAALTCRYARTVFVAPPWEAIYVNDSERWQTFDHAKSVHRAVCDVYGEFGYRPVELPLESVEARVRFVLDHARAELLSSERPDVLRAGPHRQ